MARKMCTPRTGKRSKKARKSKTGEKAANTSGGEIERDTESRDSGEIDSGITEPAPSQLEEGGEKVDTSVDESELGGGGGTDHDDEGEASGHEDEEKGKEEEEPEGGEEESDESPEDISLAKGKVMAMEQHKTEGEQIKR